MVVGKRFTQSYLDSVKVGVLMVEAGVEGGGDGIHTEIFGQYEGRSTHG